MYKHKKILISHKNKYTRDGGRKLDNPAIISGSNCLYPSILLLNKIRKFQYLYINLKYVYDIYFQLFIVKIKLFHESMKLQVWGNENMKKNINFFRKLGYKISVDLYLKI